MTRHLRFALLCVCAQIVACDSNTYAPPPPPSVTVQQPIVRDVIDYLEYTGTTRAVESVEVRARVEGFLISMEFEPGDNLERGDLRFGGTIHDPEAGQQDLYHCAELQ